MQTLEQYLTARLGTFPDFDGYYGAQCMDGAQMFNRDCVGGPPLVGNAVDVWKGAR